MGRIRFQENQILQCGSGEGARDIANCSVCDFCHGINSACHDAAICNEFSVIGNEKAMTVCTQASCSIEDRNNDDGTANRLCHFNENTDWGLLWL